MRLRRYYRQNPSFPDIPSNLFEIYRVVDPDSPEGLAFQSHMGIFYRKLFPDQKPKPVRFILTDEPHLNAFFLVSRRPPVLGFSKKLVLHTKYLEDILGIMAHELTHKIFEDEYGQHHNSKLEELTADTYPLILLADAGLDPRQYVSYVRHNIHTDTSETYSTILVDVHPTSVNRVRALEDGLAVLDQKRGGFTHLSPTLLPPEFLQIAQNSKHQSFVDLFAEGLKNLPNVEKLQKLRQIIATMSWNNRRIADMGKLLQSLKIKRSIPAEALEQNALADTILSLSETPLGDDTASSWNKQDIVFSLYRSLAAQISAEGTRPIGRLKPYEDAIYGIIEATDKEFALEASQDLLDLLAKETLQRELLARLVTWPQFKPPTFKEKSRVSRKPVSWNKQVHWAEKDSTTTIAKALIALGIADQRLFKYLSLEVAFREKKLDVLFPPLVVESYFESESSKEDSIIIDQCEIDDDGYLHQPHLQKEIKIEKRVAEEDSEILERQLAKLETWFKQISPGNFVEEEKILEEKGRLLGSEERGQPRWLCLGHSDINFLLFLELNTNILAEAGSSMNSKVPLLLARELHEVASGLIKNTGPAAKQIKESIRGLYLGFPAKHRLYRYSFEQRFINFDFPALADANPLGVLILSNPGKLFTREEQLQLLNRTAGDVEYHYRGPGSLNTSIMELARRFLGYRQPKTGKVFNQLIDKLKDGGDFVGAMLKIEFRLLLREAGRAKKVANAVPPDLNIDKVIEAATSLGIPDSDELKILFRPIVAKKTWPTQLIPLIDAWIGASNADLFPVDQVLCYSLLRTIVKKIGRIKAHNQRIELFERILFNYRIKDPKVRSQMEDLWSKAVLHQYGLDNNSIKYSNTIRPILKRLKTLTLDARLALVDRLTNQLQTQPRLTAEFKNLVHRISKEELESSFMKGAILEAAILKTRKSSRGRNQLMDFLLSELSEKSTQQMEKTLREEAADELKYSIGDDVTGPSRTVMLPGMQIRAELRFMWENFWAAPFGVRAVLFEQLLFPTISHEPAANREMADSVFDYVCNKLFPSGEPYSREARYFLEAYFHVIPSYQYRILLSAMMVTAEKSSGGNTPIGQRLAMVLELLGPAETKLGQIIHSHPQTPIEIKQGMGRLKSKADPPFRWDLMDQIQQQVLPDLKKRMRHIGALMGSASFYLAVELDLQDGMAGVLKLLRPYAEERAKNGFRIMAQMVNLLHKNFSDVTIITLKQMIAQAEQSATQEADGNLSLHQAAYAATIYDGRTVEIGDVSIGMHVCKILEAGPDYQFIQKAPGNHFNDLPEDTEDQLLYKKQIALAYYAFELSSILRGRRFDNDRHGAQLRIAGNNIYLFDWGGMLLQDPTPAELLQLGGTVFDFGMALQLGSSPENAIFQSVQTRANQGEDISYLINVQRAMLALEDFRQYIDVGVLSTLIKTLLQTNIVHPDIINGLASRAMSGGVDLAQLQEIMMQGETLPIRIKRRR